VPIPAVDCTKCGTAIMTAEIVDKTASVFDTYGAVAWWERPIEEFLPAGLTCPDCGNTSFEREKNILDVWFDSGSSNEAVLPFRPELTWPADLYLEGSDQHRGWFQSSLLVGLGTRGRPPFRQILTHGFLIDLEGRKMSKSIGNTILPQDVIKESGAEVLRLWVASCDYREELRVSKEILARIVEAYRKFRNTMRYLVANLYDFNPASDALPVSQLEEVDRFILSRYAELGLKVLDAYDAYDYPTIFQAVNAFATVDLSSLYNDISKDRLYTFAARSKERRSAQTAMYIMAEGLTRLIAPILSVSAEQLWQHLPGTHDQSVHLELFPAAAELKALVDPDLLTRWNRLSDVRERVLAQIEPLRKDKQIGSSLQARVVLSLSPDDAEFLGRYRNDLPMLFIVSEVDLRPGSDTTTIAIERADGVKCERCWRVVKSVSTDPAWAGICDRCRTALAPTGSRGAQPANA
jgi:isoleucyl-tRNA synthetase